MSPALLLALQEIVSSALSSAQEEYERLRISALPDAEQVALYGVCRQSYLAWTEELAGLLSDIETGLDHESERYALSCSREAQS